MDSGRGLHLLATDVIVHVYLWGFQGWRRSRSRRGGGLVVRAEMFGQLTTGLESAWNKLRGVGESVGFLVPTIDA
jgi:hypothetical protein